MFDRGEPDKRRANELEGLDKWVALLQTIIQDTIRDTVPLVKRSRWIRTSWSDRCTENVKRARRARRKWMAHGSQEAYVSYRETANEKKRRTKRESTLGWRETVAGIMRDPAKMWRLTKWARMTAQEPPPPPPQFPSMRDRDGMLHSSNEGKADILADRFFPSPVNADLADLAGHVYPPELPMSQEVTADEIVDILKNIAPDKAPRTDSIPNRFLRGCRDILATFGRAVSRLPAEMLSPDAIPPLQDSGNQKTAKGSIRCGKSIQAYSTAEHAREGAREGRRPPHVSVGRRVQPSAYHADGRAARTLDRNGVGNAHGADPDGLGEWPHIGGEYAESRHLRSVRQCLA